MAEEKSQIDSFDVSLGPARAPSARSASQKQLEKWNILVCSDLGFVSKKPIQVHSAEWNEFVAAQNIVLSGTLEENAPHAGKPLFVEIPVKSMKDLSPESIMANAPPFAAFSRTVYALQQLLDGKANRDDAMSMIQKAGLPQAEQARAKGLLAGGAKPSARPQNSSLDNILSMVDGTSSPGDGAPPGSASSGGPHKVTDALFKSVVDSDEGPLDKKAAAAYVRECQIKLHDLVDRLHKQPFFASRKASWNCFMALARVIGRKKEVGLSVVSGPFQDMEENLSQILSRCMESGKAPDIVIWDYGVSFSGAHMDAMSRVAKAADRYKCMVIAPLSTDDELFDGISERNSISHLFDEVRFLPFKKLRSEPSSRCLCLCGPQCSTGDRSAAPGGSCCWFVATRWTEMMLTEDNPFSAKDLRRLPVESVFSSDAIFSSDIAPSVSREAAAAGLTLFEPSIRQALLDKAVSVIDGEQAEDCYSSFLFNLAVNRVVRCAGIRLLAEGEQKSRSDVASVLQQFIRTELSAYGVTSSDGQVIATVDKEDKIVVDINSDITVSGHPVRFTFSF
jgi:Type VI secretion system, VipA, VC_A0107 or Hcp2